MNARKKLDKLCKEQLCNEVKTYDEALDFLREFTCVYDKCKSDKEYVPGLSHYDFMYWVNPIREAFAKNNYIKAVEKLIDTYMEQNDYLFQSRVKVSIMILLRQYVNSERGIYANNQNNYNQAMEYVRLTLERDGATKEDNLLFLRFMLDSIGRDIETNTLLYYVYNANDNAPIGNRVFPHTIYLENGDEIQLFSDRFEKRNIYLAK